ncbi:FAD:protein FMN transferase [Salipiger sp. CCB-MM3]|uniref:FAD:protein FMN transferase n=1 Tax=Salipiger sp. CCB-MM3 TaxID=1792508 RepID=UPI0008267493|nr:FAD:protein FMN transferase [Salipiger sp. CCB-MM3]
MSARALRLWALAVLLVAALGFGLRTGRGGEYRETVYVFGTLVEIVIQGERPARARAAAGDVAQLLQGLHGAWHAWQSGALSDLNAALASGEPASVPPNLASALSRARDLSCASGGRFEPAIGALIGLWGFHQDTPPEGAPPDPARIAALRAAQPKMTDLILDGTRVRSTNRAVQLDLGGFAKGAALEQAVAVLHARGIENAVLNAGGDVTVSGGNGARPWRVAIRDPFVWGAVASVALKPGESLYTSGNYERYFEYSGTRFAHIIDPKTGWPVQQIVSVTVLDSDPSRADAAATALSVAGAQDWPQVASDMGVDAVLLIDEAGRMFASPRMRARLSPVGDGFPAEITEVPLPPAIARHCAPAGMSFAEIRKSGPSRVAFLPHSK